MRVYSAPGRRKPEAYQPAGGDETQVTAAFRAYAKGESGFEVGRYDRARTLIIDPVLASSLNFGGIGVEGLVAGVGDMGNAIALGPAAWLYRISTNACLNALASRKHVRRRLPDQLAPATLPVESG